MFLAKNLLIGLGSAGIIGVGGYGIYSATKSSSKDITDNKENVNSDNERDSGKSTPLAGSQSGSEGTQSKGSDNSTRANVGTGDTAGSPPTTAGGRGENPGSGE